MLDHQAGLAPPPWQVLHTSHWFSSYQQALVRVTLCYMTDFSLNSRGMGLLFHPGNRHLLCPYYVHSAVLISEQNKVTVFIDLCFETKVETKWNNRFNA